MKSESEYAQAVMAWLSRQGWDVYPEVVVGSTRRRIDIVAIRNNISVAVEVKTGATIKVFDQAYRSLWIANYVFVAIPAEKSHSVFENHFLLNAIRENGIGVLEVSRSHISISIDAKLHRVKKSISVARYLSPEQKKYVPGNSDNEYWTPFKNTVKLLVDCVSRHPGILLKDAIESIPHHYSNEISARSNISSLIDAGVINNLIKVRDGKYVKLYLKE